MNPVIAGRMFAAEVLKLRRNRTIIAVALLLSVGVIAAMFGYAAIEHASSPAENGPAGGLEGFSRAVRVLGVYFGTLVAALIGVEAGTADLGSGVFRDLVATGRARAALYWIRVPAAVLVTFAINLTAFAVALVLSFALSGGLATPGLGLILQSIAWILLCNGVIAAFAVGIGSLTGSRGAALTAVIGWQTVAVELIMRTPSFGSARDALLTPAFGQLVPVSGELAGITMATGLAVAVIAIWAIVSTGVGAWRTATCDA